MSGLSYRSRDPSGSALNNNNYETIAWWQGGLLQRCLGLGVNLDVALKARDSTGLVEKCVCNLIKLGHLCYLPMWYTPPNQRPLDVYSIADHLLGQRSERRRPTHKPKHRNSFEV